MKITQDMIRRKAYELWEARGRRAGNPEDDWYAAEALLRESTSGSGATPKRAPGTTRYGLRKSGAA